MIYIYTSRLVGGDWNMASMIFHILGMSSSQLIIYIYIILMVDIS